MCLCFKNVVSFFNSCCISYEVTPFITFKFFVCATDCAFQNGKISKVWPHCNMIFCVSLSPTELWSVSCGQNSRSCSWCISIFLVDYDIIMKVLGKFSGNEYSFKVNVGFTFSSISV